MTDTRFRALGQVPKIGTRAQLLFLAIQPFADDQGRLLADAVAMQVTPAMRGMGPSVITACLKAIDTCKLGILYEEEDRTLLQLTDWHIVNHNLRWKEPSKLPPPPHWKGDVLRSWQDDPNTKGSRARKALEQSGDTDSSARRNPQNEAEGRSTSPQVSSLKSEGEDEVKSKSKLQAHQPDQRVAIAIVETVDQALRRNRSCQQPGLLGTANGSAGRAAEQVVTWLGHGIPRVWLEPKLIDLASRAQKPIKGLRFFDKVIFEDWQAEREKRAVRGRSRAEPASIGTMIGETLRDIQK
jgi:hypothetical protein